MKSMMTFIATLILGLFILLVGVLYFLQDGFIFPAPQIDDRVKLPNGFDPVSITTPDGETLAAYFHPPEEGGPTIIVFHGNGDAALYQGEKGQALRDAGYGVLLAEYRGYGHSSGKPSEKGLLIDAKASYDFVRAKNDGPIGLYGHSLGTGVAVPLATHEDVFAVVLEAPFDSLMAVAQGRLPWAPVKPFLRHKFRSDLFIEKVKAPLLIMHGDADRVIPLKHSQKLASLAPEGVEFMEIKGGGHGLGASGATQIAIAFFDQVSGER